MEGNIKKESPNQWHDLQSSGAISDDPSSKDSPIHKRIWGSKNAEIRS